MQSKRFGFFFYAGVALMVAAGGRLAPLSAATNNAALPFVSPMFGDNMVLQRGKANRFWGWAEAGQTVRVEIAGCAAKAVAGPDERGNFRGTIHPQLGPH